MKPVMPNLPIQAYDYPLPEDKIALFPTKNRDESKLLVYQNSQIQHHSFQDFPALLPPNSLLVFNNTKVIPARIPLQKASGTAIELFLLKPVEEAEATQVAMQAEGEVVWNCLIGNKKRWKQGEMIEKKISLGEKELVLQIHWHHRDQNQVRIRWEDSISFATILDAIGKIPLPPYMSRDVEEGDKDRYQTLFSKELGAVAAPTASLHFSEKIMEDLDQRGVHKTFLTLHVGAGTFMPVKEEHVENHPMHREQMIFSSDQILNLLNHQGPFIPVGTTALRALESLYWAGVFLLENGIIPEVGFILPKEFAYKTRQLTFAREEALKAVIDYMKRMGMKQWMMETELLIMPGYSLQFCDALVTNFHQPKSTLLVLVSALIGDAWKDVYREALENNYRFLSYGDASILFNVKFAL
jgi:S-adenosylmethionine:tRNA ribosyltransferase-isomerase